MIDERLLELLRKQEDLQYDDTISDDLYYMLDEKISNEIANNYTIEEIEQAQKYLESEKNN